MRPTWVSAARRCLALLALAPALLGMASARKGPRAVRLIYTAGLRGVLEPCGCQPLQPGGLSRRATLLRRLAVPGQTPVLIDAGDNLPPEGARPEALTLTYRLLKRMGYDAIGVGPYDLALPAGQIERAARRAGITLLARPVPNRAGRWAPAVRIVRAGAARVALIGAVPGSPGQGMGTVIRRVADLARQVRRSADLVVVVAQLAPEEVVRCARQVPQVDLFLSGRQDLDLSGPTRVAAAYVLPCAAYGQSVGMAEIDLRPHGGIRNLKLAFRPVDPGLRKDPSVTAAITDYYARFSTLTAPPTKPRVTDAVLAGALSGPETAQLACQSCHESEFAAWSRTRHAHAWQTLVEKGADARSDCIRCHTTGQLTLNSFGGDVTGVSCAACHGGDPDHARHPADPRFIVRRPAEPVCRTCHTPLSSPHFTYPWFLKLVKHAPPPGSALSRPARERQTAPRLAGPGS